MRFSIRDLLWATLVVAMGLGWWADRRRVDATYDAEIDSLNAQRLEAIDSLNSRRLKAVRQAQKLHVALRDARIATEKHQEQLLAIMDALDRSSVGLNNEARQRLDRLEAVPVDDRVLDEPLVEP